MPEKERVRRAENFETEERVFAKWICGKFSSDPELAEQVASIRLQSSNLFTWIKDGILLCKLVNRAVPNTIDERAINKSNLTLRARLENVTLALISAQAIGCNINDHDYTGIAMGNPAIVLRLLWKIIRTVLVSQLDLVRCPGLSRLLREHEKLINFRALSHEKILLRWVNYQLSAAGVDRQMSNFASDVSDSVIYIELLHHIAPRSSSVTRSPLTIPSKRERAEAMLAMAEKVDCREFITAADIVNGNSMLNFAFVANIFNKYHNLQDSGISVEAVAEPRLEKTYRNWLNSLGVVPHVNCLLEDLRSGDIIYQYRPTSRGHGCNGCNGCILKIHANCGLYRRRTFSILHFSK